ncbi:hypothetical protein C7957_1456 [Halanaerobium saccharolyticum]|jgi:hypothetical protein|uniref:Uncharacterized protein n=1 Tax=Halanaerobium saccharolyticum TaxID=43595 RepID=A0A4R6RAC8_9FIRM|nr:hypothetical protein [Halanaerobium saccharolyticum]TDP83061.1 hypothetical protein C7957_1456 [Halanaerobium saccharolyticum]
MKKLMLVVISIILIFILTGCGSDSINNTIEDEINDPTAGEIKVSFIAEENLTAAQSNEVTAQVNSGRYQHFEFNQSNYAEKYKNLEESNLVGRYTPESMIVEINSIQLANPNSQRPISKVARIDRAERSSSVILPAFDLTLANKIIDASYLYESNFNEYSNVNMTFNIKNAERRQERFSAVSEIHVDLGEEYRDVDLGAFRKEGTVHVFQLSDLIPLDGNSEASVLDILFDDQVEEAFMINPFLEGKDYIDGIAPYFWSEERPLWSRRGYMIYLPGLNFDLNTDGNHLVFSWQLKDLIEVYAPEGTADKSEHIVTLNLENPFPINFKLEKLSEDQSGDGSSKLDKEITHLEGRYYDLMDKEIVLKWVNPTSNNFKQVIINRSLTDFPEGIDDGETVYQDNFPLFKDEDIERNKEYYYRIMVEDFNGNITPGETIKVDSEPFQLIDLELKNENWREVLPEQITINAGEEYFIEAIGYIEHDEYSRENVSVAPDWTTTDAEVADLKYKKGESTYIEAVKPGETIIKAELDPAFGEVTEAQIKVIVE